ncbi:biopolymer transporter ExbD [Dysgonomonas sp. 216]|uniref:ExbD/TolR family protein n=1 Tax=Dysgonomonas sp. 216 TaxID=2302934 RepID=UPI0013D41B4D|nr:biopolymer transporter ExbD [Dysgonomonas sp. 216]NDW17947.1 biopolymer transporter ExbD [Dysgonomonas sp. 216]
MANIDTGGGEQKKGKPKKINLRVDFTPMVDMNMLLLTFFMFCTSLAKPQIMDIVMPTKDNQDLTEDELNMVKDSKTITLLLGEENRVYYYYGKPNYEDYKSLMVADYSSEDSGLRAAILQRDRKSYDQMIDLRKKRAKGQMSEDEFKKQADEIRKDPDGLVVVIKPMESSTYKNLVDALDEMQICGIGKYAIVEVAEGDDFVLENYKTKGRHAAERQQ